MGGRYSTACTTVENERMPGKLATSILQIERLSNHQNQLLTDAIGSIIDYNPSDAVFLASEV
jgi:hypothetical protein